MLSAQVPVLESGRNDESWVDAEVRGLGNRGGGGGFPGPALGISQVSKPTGKPASDLESRQSQRVLTHSSHPLGL